MFRQTFELLPQHWVLCCNAHRAGIEMTLSHHDASHSNQWCLTSFGGALGCLQGTKITSGIQIMQGSVWWDLFIDELQKLTECINSLNSLDWFESLVQSKFLLRKNQKKTNSTPLNSLNLYLDFSRCSHQWKFRNGFFLYICMLFLQCQYSIKIHPQKQTNRALSPEKSPSQKEFGGSSIHSLWEAAAELWEALIWRR